MPMSETFPGTLARMVDRLGDREFLVTPQARLTYRGVEESSRQLAKALVGAGVGKGSRVGIQFPNGPEWVTAWLAVTRIGAIAVPISTFYQPPEMAWVLAHADVELLLTSRMMFGRDFAAVLEEALPDLVGSEAGAYRLSRAPFLRSVMMWGDEAPAWAWHPDAHIDALGRDVGDELIRAREDCVSPADVAVILYSSGSTARPKGALHSQGGILRRVRNLRQYRHHADGDRVFLPMPFFWVGGLVVGWIDVFDNGLTCLCCDGDPETILRFVSQERVTVFSAWPATLLALAREYAGGDYDLSNVRSGNFVDALPPESRPKDPLLRTNSLGMTETFGPHTWGNPLVDLPEELRGSFGTATPDVEHQVIDPESGRVLGPGESGEIRVRGPNMMLGLHKRDRNEVFDADGWYPTGDFGRFDGNGVLFFEGRRDEQIKTAGVNVSAREVEATLMAFDDVSLAAVVGLPNPDRGRIIAAAVFPEKGASPTPRELWERLRKKMSSFMVPRLIWVCGPGDMPMTTSGKVDKKRLEVEMKTQGELLVSD